MWHAKSLSTVFLRLPDCFRDLIGGGESTHLAQSAVRLPLRTAFGLLSHSPSRKDLISLGQDDGWRRWRALDDELAHFLFKTPEPLTRGTGSAASSIPAMNGSRPATKTSLDCGAAGALENGSLLKRSSTGAGASTSRFSTCISEPVRQTSPMPLSVSIGEIDVFQDKSASSGIVVVHKSDVLALVVVRIWE